MVAEANIVRDIFNGEFPHDLIIEMTPYDDTHVDNSALVGSRVFTHTMGDRMPEDMINTIISFHGTDYDRICHEYTWEEIENMVSYFVDQGPNCCEYVFRMFERMGEDLNIFYPNAASDNSIKRNEEYIYDENNGVYGISFKTGVSFEMREWFYSDYMKMPGGGKKWYWDDDATNYDDIVFMINRTLKKFDKWYWKNYTEHTDGQVRVKETIVRVYTALEKYCKMTSEEIYVDQDIRGERYRPLAYTITW